MQKQTIQKQSSLRTQMSDLKLNRAETLKRQNSLRTQQSALDLNSFHRQNTPRGKVIDIDTSKKLEQMEYQCVDSIKSGLARLSNIDQNVIEACNDDAQLLNLKAQHGLLSTVQIAHSYHYPLQLAPDDIWTMIMQGFCEHMKHNHEQLRSKFVSFEGKKDLTVFRNNFIKGSPSNDWPSVFSDFSTQIKANIGAQNHKNLMPEFSSSNPLRKIVQELSVVNAMQHFFNFKCQTACGISKVKLEGTLGDWQKLKIYTLKLNEYGLEWWTPTLIEIIDKIIETHSGKNTNIDFWNYIFKYYEGFGSGVNDSIDGWIVNLIPYIDDKPSPLAKRTLDQTFQDYTARDVVSDNEMGEEESDDDWINQEHDMTQPGLDIEKLKKSASGISVTPFMWDNNGAEIKMNFISGFAGATLTDDGFVKPQLGWAVAEFQEPKKRKSKGKALISPTKQIRKSAKENWANVSKNFHEAKASVLRSGKQFRNEFITNFK